MANIPTHKPNSPAHKQRDYQDLQNTFTWDVPETFNFATDVVDYWAHTKDGPCLHWEGQANGAAKKRSFLFSDMSRLTKKFANMLRAQGIKKGDRIIVNMPRVPEWQIAIVGAMRIGVVPIPCIEMLTPRDLEYRIENSGAKGVVCRARSIEKYAESSEGLIARIALYDNDDAPNADWLDFSATLEQASAEITSETVHAEDPAIIYYTSGSTGHPKGVLHSARGLYTWRMSARYWLDIGPGDIIWCTADTGWSKAGTSILFGPWSEGACAFFYDGDFVPAERLRLLSDHKITAYCAPATELNRIVQEDISQWDLSSLRRTISAGEAMNPAVAEKWHAATGIEIAEAYGQTETLMITLNIAGVKVKLGSMGLPSPGCDVDVVDENGMRMKNEEDGDIAIMTPNPQMMLGYWQDEARTAQCFRDGPDGRWYITGDRGRRDEEGYLWYSGRSDDVINSAGYRIGPLEVENALLEDENVLECAVIGAPDPDRGEIVKAFIVLKEGVSPSGDLTRHLQNHVKSYTAPYKYPREISYCDELPKTQTGKIMRRALRDQAYAQQKA